MHQILNQTALESTYMQNRNCGNIRNGIKSIQRQIIKTNTDFNLNELWDLITKSESTSERAYPKDDLPKKLAKKSTIYKLSK